MKELCGTVGFSLARSVLKTVAEVEEPDKLRDMPKLTIAFEKLQDLARGVERLRAAVTKCGAERYSTLCHEMKLASDSIDDIPDRATLRQLLQTLEADTVQDQSGAEQKRQAANTETNGSRDLGDLRGRLLREAARVSGATNRTLGDVIQEAAKGAFTLATLRTLENSDAGKLEATLRKLEQTAVAP